MDQDQNMNPVESAPVPVAPVAAPAPAAEPKKGTAYGTILGIVLIVVILVVGAFYVWGARLEKEQPVLPDNESAASADVNATVPQLQ
jgi:hypothetical protein